MDDGNVMQKTQIDQLLLVPLVEIDPQYFVAKSCVTWIAPLPCLLLALSANLLFFYLEGY